MIHGHESIVGAPLVKSISQLSARAATVVPPQSRARLCRLGLGSAMPDLCSVLASPALDVVHALAAPINANFFPPTHPAICFGMLVACIGACPKAEIEHPE